MGDVSSEYFRRTIRKLAEKGRPRQVLRIRGNPPASISRAGLGLSEEQTAESSYLWPSVVHFFQAKPSGRSGFYDSRSFTTLEQVANIIRFKFTNPDVEQGSGYAADHLVQEATAQCLDLYALSRPDDL
jgi:hypothetical protein